MSAKESVSLFWFRRDLRLNDNIGLKAALQGATSVQPIFIFDTGILELLPHRKDRRVDFIHQALKHLNRELSSHGASLLTFHDTVERSFEELCKKFDVKAVYTNHDYEPQAIARDEAVRKQLKEKGIEFKTFKDQVIFEKDEVSKGDGSPYHVFTPYKNKWLSRLHELSINSKGKAMWQNLRRSVNSEIPSLRSLGFEKTDIFFDPKFEVSTRLIRHYKENRDIPADDATSRAGIHLRFGTLSIRELVLHAMKEEGTFLSELVWREFFMAILFHYPRVVKESFRSEYDRIRWINKESDFKRWCDGMTGYPLVDAGMRQLNQTGFMHNRVRMVTASFLCKHLLIDWRWGESYFAGLLDDYELSSNNGNWQWAAGTGCDAAPYFRIFNPAEQQKRFDPEFQYIRRWVPEFATPAYPAPMIDHKMARGRALEAYQKAVK